MLWSSAKVSKFYGPCDPVLYTALRHWPDLLREGVLQKDPKARPSAKNMAQIAYAYGKPMNSFTSPEVRHCCRAKALPCAWPLDLALVSLQIGHTRLSHATLHNCTIAHGDSDNSQPSAYVVQSEDGDVPLAFAGVLPLYIRCIPDFAPLTLSIVLWAYVSLRSSQEVVNKLAWAMYPAVCAKLNKFRPAELVAIAYALGLARLRHEPLLDIVTGQCTARLRSFTGEVRFSTCVPAGLPAESVRIRSLAAAASRAPKPSRLAKQTYFARKARSCTSESGWHSAQVEVTAARRLSITGQAFRAGKVPCRSAVCLRGRSDVWHIRTTRCLRRSSSNICSRACWNPSAWAS